jgi:hypothetical protein
LWAPLFLWPWAAVETRKPPTRSTDPYQVIMKKKKKKKKDFEESLVAL